jgi:hypothetical protein
MRTCTGQLCIEVNKHENLDPAESQQLPLYDPKNPSVGLHLTINSNLDQQVISALNVDDIHLILSGKINKYAATISKAGTIFLGCVSWRKPGDTEELYQFSNISLLDCLGLSDRGVKVWEYANADGQRVADTAILPTGWTR